MSKKQAESSVAVHIDHASEVLDGLKKAYAMELETVLNYLAATVNLEGVRAEEIKKNLAAEALDELGHAQALARRIHVMGGTVPGSKALSFTFNQHALQPLDDTGDLRSVIQGVIEAEEAACQHYQQMIDLCDSKDMVTQELCIRLLGDEEEHRRQYQSYQKEFDRLRL
jgi:bacterioferritin